MKGEEVLRCMRELGDFIRFDKANIAERQFTCEDCWHSAHLNWEVCG